MKTLKKYLIAWRLFKTVGRNAAIVHIMKGIDDLIKDVIRTGRPHHTQIVNVHIPTGMKVTDIVTIWAGCGEANAIHRLREVSEQRNVMCDMLKKLQENNFDPSEEDKVLVKYYIDFK